MICVGFLTPDRTRDGFDRTKVCYGNPTLDHIKDAAEDQWLLTYELRAKLYTSLFKRSDLRPLWSPWLKEIVESNIAEVKLIEKFALQVATICIGNQYSVAFPNLEYFIDDAISLLQILNEDCSKLKLRESPQICLKMSHPFKRFKDKRSVSWIDRWPSNCIDSKAVSTEAILDNYVCGLCDALFGLLPACDAPIFHNDSSRQNSLGIRQLSSFYKPGVIGIENSQKLDFSLFNAAYIESRGPFRFKATDSVDKYLVVTDDKHILFYHNWRKWAFLHQHVLLERGQMERKNNSRFCFLANFDRRAMASCNDYGPAMSMISTDIHFTSL